MKIVFTSYAGAPEFTDPKKWLQRLAGYTGILEILATEHQVYGIERIKYEGSFFKNGVNYIFIRQTKKIVRFPFRIHHLIKKINPDIIFINGLVFPFQLIQLRFILNKNAKIFLLHRAHKPYSGIKMYLQQLADRFIDGYLFTSSENSQEWIDTGLIRNSDKIYEVIPGSSSFLYKNRSSSRESTGISGVQVFLWVGRLEANKDPLTVTKAFIEYLKFQPEARLYFIYQQDDLLPEVQDLIEQSRSKKNIILVGKKTNEELEAWYNSADYILSSSYNESGGVAVSEAMSCGCIPILTNIPSFRKMTGAGLCGMLYEAGDTAALLACLIKTKQVDIEKEKEKVLKQFMHELSYEAIGKKINKIINQPA